MKKSIQALLEFLPQLEDCIKQGTSYKDAIRRSRFSEVYLRKCFREITGMALREYVMRRELTVVRLTISDLDTISTHQTVHGIKRFKLKYLEAISQYPYALQGSILMDPLRDLQLTHGDCFLYDLDQLFVCGLCVVHFSITIQLQDEGLGSVSLLELANRGAEDVIIEVFNLRKSGGNRLPWPYSLDVCFQYNSTEFFPVTVYKHPDYDNTGCVSRNGLVAANGNVYLQVPRLMYGDILVRVLGINKYDKSRIILSIYGRDINRMLQYLSAIHKRHHS